MVLDSAPAKEQLLSSGIGEIDKKLGGGLPLGSLTLIEGESDAGKTPVVQQLIHGALASGKRVALYTTENTTISLLRQMKSLNIEAEDYFILGRLSVFALPLAVQEESAGALYATLLSHARSLDVDAVFIDGATALVSHSEERETLDFFSGARELCDHGKTMVVAMHSYACGEELLVRMLALCDAHLRLSVEDLGRRLCKTMEIAKVRGATRAGGAYTVCFDVEPELGITIIPVFKAKL